MNGGADPPVHTQPAAPRPARRVRVLHLEDSEPDHALALAHLRRSALTVQALRVESRAEFEAALAQPWDVVLSDYHLPGFTGIEALQLLRERGAAQDCEPGANLALLPFILVSGQIGEDTAVEAMRNGASDYLLKNNLARLAPAMEHAIAAAESQRARLAADQELQVSRRRLQELAQHLQTSVEAERHAIAREIHDDVGGSLTALKFELDWMRRHLHAHAHAHAHAQAQTGSGALLAAQPAELPAELPARVASALELVTHAVEASQRIMQNLRPAILEQGLLAALQWMTGNFEKRTGIPCELRVSMAQPGERGADEPGLPLPAGAALVAYRTVQEALTNISKHAQASHVVVDVASGAGVLSLEVSDNGRGLAPGALAKTQSFGIRGLHERASTVGGWMDLSSGPAGTSLILSVPLGPHAAPAGPDGLQHATDDDAEAAAWSTRY